VRLLIPAASAADISDHRAVWRYRCRDRGDEREFAEWAWESAPDPPTRHQLSPKVTRTSVTLSSQDRIHAVRGRP
jgi:hypothetical protein